ncbi:pyocin knob domain-containing protein [Enterobacter ludwigii]|uniref:pyocin knob domain-containing protein n=1 Tax=Enterobacter ludwigii TaxID=299767 RepID=UPI001E4C3C26|nr:pyocin knob domain-containing protein [Enterobacter ludwigii]MCE1610277.1 pyocin knob domain-containing protein [Enterobacter ludwigii]MCE1623573.1 pyocin knob domain-containing protein [Enterobacter ludwigii]
MILGFGNNVVSSLASDITASQTTFSVIPGDGPLFASLLTSDFSNKSTTLKTYAKITLTDSGETAFEVCHLTAVSGDTLTVIRGQEGTAAKGWALKDVVSNFATRGSENSFPQIAHIQSGFYTSGSAGGTANALTLELPTTFFLNGSADWVLKTPIVVYPTQNNTGAATLQLTMGGRVLGTFPLYKGNKAALVANDILKDVALVCLLDNTKTFFNVANPGAIYAGLGTAAFADLVISKTDYTAGRVLTTGWMSLGGYGTDNLIAAADAKQSLRNGFYAVSSEPTYGNSSLISFGYDTGSQVHIIAKQGGQAPLLGVCGSTPQGAFGNWGKIYTEFQKPTALDVGAVPYRGPLGTDDLNTITGSKYGRFCQPLTANATAARNYPITEAGALDVHQTSANGAEACVQEYRSFSSRRIFLRTYNPTGSVWTDWCEFYTTAKKPTAADVGAIPLSGSTAVTGIVRSSTEWQSSYANSFRIGYGGYGTFWRNDGANLYLMLTNQNDPWGNYNALRPFMVNVTNGDVTIGKLALSNYTYFDARYQPKGNYTPTGTAYTKAESDARYQTKGNYISAMRLGSQAGANNNNSGWAMAPGGAVLTGSYQDANYTAVYYRYPQYQLNGSATWYNTGAA